MRSTVVGFVVGVMLLQWQSSLPAPWLPALLLIAGVAGIVRFRHPLWRLPCGLALGFAWAALCAHWYLARELPRELEGRDIAVIGTIDSLPEYFERGVRFNFAVERVLDAQAQEVPPRLALSWYTAFATDDVQQVGKLLPGERWQLTVRLRRPHGNANPHGFDYEAWLLEQNLRATGYVRPAADTRKLAGFVPGIGNMVQRSRAWLRERIQAALPGKEYASVIVALVIGDQDGIAQSDWQVFNRTGIGHLISISGLHITMIAGLCAALVFALWRRSFFTQAQLPLLLPAQKAAALAGAVTALLYVALAGFGVPAQRTLYMLSVVAAALWFGRIANVSHVLCAALGAVVLFDPWAVLWPGFWLSFGAVAIILYASVGRAAVPRTGWRVTLRAAAHTQYVVTLGLIPLTMLLFGQISLVSPLANAVAIPLVSFVVTPLSLLGSVLPAPLPGWLLGCAHQLVEWMAAALAWLSVLSFAVWNTPLPAWWMFAAAALGMLWLLAPAGWPARYLGCIGLLPLVLNTATHPADGEMRITAFDVGQGTAVLIETPRHRLLYDTGPAYSAESDSGSRVILPYLRARGINRLDGIIVSHSDTDHAGGALSILGALEVDWLSSSLPESHPIASRAALHRRCEAGQAWTWDGVGFEILHPAPASYASDKWKPNARSCTLKVTLGEQSILLPGDIEAVQEDELVNKDARALQATVLLAPHHGSGTSSTLSFLQAVRPQLALFQVGYRNRYRHPKPEIFERYGALGIRRLRSDESGAITLRFGQGLDVTEYRTEEAHYWYGR